MLYAHAEHSSQTQDFSARIPVMVGKHSLRRLPEQQERFGRIEIILHGSFETTTQDLILPLSIASYQFANLLEKPHHLGCGLQIGGETLPWVAILMAL
jgi:hypothetical protein